MTAVTHAPQCLSRYRVEGAIGQGPSATVFKAYDPVGDRPVVLKSLRREVAMRALGPRLLEQARAAAKLSHPGIVAIHDVEQSDTAAVIVMEYVAGQNLSDWLAAAALPQAGVVLQVMDQLLEALAFAHHAGLRHGALHAGNVLVTATGGVKIADFGMARLSEPATLSAAMRGLVAPEIAQGRPLDNGVDVYAAGVLLYRMLTGREPELGTPSGGPAFPIGAARAPSTFAEARRSPAFDAIVAKALAREPGDRYPTAEAFREALAGALEEAPRPVHGTQSVEIGRGATESAPQVPGEAARAASAGTAPRSHLALVRSDGQPARLALVGAPPAGSASSAPASDRPDRKALGGRPAPGAKRATDAPTLTIAIPEAMLAMPAFDPWVEATPAAPAPAKDEAVDAADACDPADGDGVRHLVDQAERGRRAQVVSAARAANEALAAAASSSANEPLIEAEPFDPPSDSVFQDDAALLVSSPVSPGIPVEALRRVLKILTPHFGARAGTVLKQVAGRAVDVAELHAMLVEEAGETVDRRRLKKQLKALARLPL